MVRIILFSVVAVSLCGLSSCGEARLEVSAGSPIHRSGIIDGKPTSGTDEYNAVGALLVYAESNGEVFGDFACSGTLIRSDVFLTAAHCIRLFEPDADDGITMRWLVSFSEDVSEFGWETFDIPTVGVSEVIVHPDFESPGNLYLPHRLGYWADIALLFLEEDISWIKPIPILGEEHRRSLHPGNSVVIAGYGERMPETKESVHGLRYFGPSYLHDVGEYELRVGRVEGVDGIAPQEGLAEKCYGDSGGPTFLRTQDGGRLIGVTSRGDDGDDDCERAGVDTRVDAFSEWILAELKRGCRQGKRASLDCWSEFSEESQLPRCELSETGGGCAAVGGPGWATILAFILGRSRFCRRDR